MDLTRFWVERVEAPKPFRKLDQVDWIFVLRKAALFSTRGSTWGTWFHNSTKTETRGMRVQKSKNKSIPSQYHSKIIFLLNKTPQKTVSGWAQSCFTPEANGIIAGWKLNLDSCGNFTQNDVCWLFDCHFFHLHSSGWINLVTRSGVKSHKTIHLKFESFQRFFPQPELILRKKMPCFNFFSHGSSRATCVFWELTLRVGCLCRMVALCSLRVAKA